MLSKQTTFANGEDLAEETVAQLCMALIRAGSFCHHVNIPRWALTPFWEHPG